MTKPGVPVIYEDDDPRLLKFLHEHKHSPGIPWNSVKDEFLGKPKRKRAAGKRRHPAKSR